MTDVIVIGAGGGGPVVAKELAERGLDVLVLEAGPRFARPSQEWRHLENDANNPVTGYFRVGSSDRTKPAGIREVPQSSFVWQVSGVGGTTLHYYANCPRAEPGVFHGYDKPDRNSYDRAHEFPFTYRSLIPYYEWVEETLPVQTAPMGRKEEAFLHGASKMLPVQASKDITRAAFRPQENAILQPHGTAGRVHNPLYPHAEGCTFCGFCFQGCIEPRQSPRNLRAKRSTDNSYMPMALTADLWRRGGKAVKLLTDAYVTQIHTTTKGSQTIAGGVTWRDNVTGDMHSESAKVVVMAGGCVETPRLWLNSRLPNPNGWVGKGFTDHYFDWIIGVMPHDIGSSRGAGSNARCDFPGYGGLEQVGLPPALQAFSATFSNAGMAGYYDNGASASGVSKQGAQSLGRLVGKDLLNLVEQVDRMLNVLVLTDDDVQPQNQVSLSTSLPPDEHGPVPRVSFPRGIRTARTLRNREYLAAKAVELVKHAGATRVYRLDWPDLILHVQSTMRMGSDPSTSVVDASSEARFVKRLFIADNSALANCLGGPNPTLTSQALATRAAQTIFTRYFGGHPWVGHEAPVSSIDDRVTQAVFARGIADAPASSRKPSRPSTHRKSVPRPTFTG
jgi:choline dehydrogenase-like flavoprotein